MFDFCLPRFGISNPAGAIFAVPSSLSNGFALYVPRPFSPRSWKRFSPSTRSPGTAITASRGYGRRVLENGLRLAAETGANVEVVRLFAVLHDSRHWNENHNHSHGPRTAAFATALRGRLFDLPDAEFRLLYTAPARGTRTSERILISLCKPASIPTASISAASASPLTLVIYAPTPPNAPTPSAGPTAAAPRNSAGPCLRRVGDRPSA